VKFAAGFLSCAALIAALGLFGKLFAGETWLVGSVGSYHFEREKKYCEFNPGIGIEHAVAENTRVVVGQYTNSFCRPSAYLGVSYAALTYGHFKLGAAIIAVTGYEKTAKKDNQAQEIMLAPLGVLAYERGRYGANIILAPPHGEFSGALGLQLKVRF
jgi:hypothetical protein